MYIVVLNVLYDDVYMYKSLQTQFKICSVLFNLSTESSDESTEGRRLWNVGGGSV